MVFGLVPLLVVGPIVIILLAVRLAHDSAPVRAATGQAMIDFSWAAASRGGGRFSVPYMLGATAPSYPCWVGGTAIGVFAGDLIGDPGALGLDALFPAFAASRRALPPAWDALAAARSLKGHEE